MHPKLKQCKKCLVTPELETHGVSYIIICKKCNAKTTTAPLYLTHEVSRIHEEWNDKN